MSTCPSCHSSRAMRPFLSFYGAKWRAARLYPAPKYGVVIEPFAGSAGYSTWWGVPKALLIERDPIIAAVWHYLIKAKASEVRALPLLLPGQSVDALPIPQEAKWLIGFWINGATSSPRKHLSKWGLIHLRKGTANVWSEKKREQLAAQVDHIRDWSIVCDSYETAPNVEGTWFIDPPYQVAGVHYKHQVTDYLALARFSVARYGQVIVCENEGATWLPFKPFAHWKAAQRGKRGAMTREMWHYSESFVRAVPNVVS